MATKEDIEKIRETLSEAGVVLDDTTIRKISQELSRKGLESAKPRWFCQPGLYCVVINDEIVEM